MATNRIEAAKTAPPREKDPSEPEALPVVSGPSAGKAWLPLALNLVLLPAVAYAMTTYVLVPKMRRELQGPAASPAAAAAPAVPGKGKVMVPLNGKVLVNVAGTMGTRYLLANITLVGSHPDLKSLVEKSDAQLRDAASSTLATKTIADLEKPGSRNLIRSELSSIFNSILGAGMVTEIYLTEFAIQ